MTPSRRLFAWALLFGGLLTLGLACDSGEPGPDPPEPGSLAAALDGEDGFFEAADAVATDEHLFVALAQHTKDAVLGVLTYEEIWLLTLDRRAGTWIAEPISRSVEPDQHPALARTPDGTVHVVWSEATERAAELFARRLWHAQRRPDGTWTAPTLAWEGSPRIGATLTGASRPALAVDGAGRLHAVFSAEYDDGGFPGPQVSVITYEGGRGVRRCSRQGGWAAQTKLLRERRQRGRRCCHGWGGLPPSRVGRG